MSHKYPIKDVQYHEERIREVASHELSVDEAIAIAWHSTALAYLRFGAFHQMPGPAAERKVEGEVIPALIEDYLVPATDSHGMTYFQHVWKDD